MGLLQVHRLADSVAIADVVVHRGVPVVGELVAVGETQARWPGIRAALRRSIGLVDGRGVARTESSSVAQLDG